MRCHLGATCSQSLFLGGAAHGCLLAVSGSTSACCGDASASAILSFEMVGSSTCAGIWLFGASETGRIMSSVGASILALLPVLSAIHHTSSSAGVRLRHTLFISISSSGG